MRYFGAYETVGAAHIPPIFKWKSDMFLREAGFEILHECFSEQVFNTGTNFQGKIGGIVSKLLYPMVKGQKDGDGRIIVAGLLKKGVDHK